MIKKNSNDIKLSITWLGQGSFLFESSNTRFLIDPFMSNIVEQREGLKRLMEFPFSIEELNPDYIFISHVHIDHFDPIALPKIHESYPEVLIYGPKSVFEMAVQMDFTISKLRMLSVGEAFLAGDFNVITTPAYHSDPYSLGCVIELNEFVIYLSADTILTDFLAAQIKDIAQKDINLVVCCINGKLGNMNWKDAVQLTKSLNPEVAIPMHYGMFAENTEDSSLFIKGCLNDGLNAIELLPGQPVLF